MLDILKLLAVSEAEVAEPTEMETTVQTEDVETEVQDTESELPSEFEIDGEKYSINDIKEWKNSAMSSKEYLSKASEIQKQAEQYKDAIELFNYLQGKPDLVQKLYEMDESAPKVDYVKNPEVAELRQEVRKMQIEKDLELLKIKDKDISETEILNIAIQHNTDINSAYDLWRGMNFEKILKSKLKEQSKTLTENISKNKESTKTLISKGDGVSNTQELGLSALELQFAQKLGMTPEEYKKWKV